MTWVPAVIVIFIIMLLFLAGVASLNLNPLRERPGISLSEVEGINIDYVLSLDVLRYLNNNREIISNWADDGFVLPHNKWVLGESDEKMDQLCASLEDFKDSFDLKTHALYLFSEQEQGREMMILEVREGNFVCRLGSPNESPFISELTINVNSYFLSEEGNLVRVVYKRR